MVGGIELTALYDTLMRYNPDTGQFEPRLAQSLTANADNTQWTLKLRPGVTFTDGSPLDSAAVVASMKRHIDKKSRSLSLVQPIKEFQTPDAETVVFVLAAPVGQLPVRPGVGTRHDHQPGGGDEGGRLVPDQSGRRGAGPFIFDSFKPNESITLKRNPDYWAATCTSISWSSCRSSARPRPTRR